MIQCIGLTEAAEFDAFVEKNNGSFLQSSLWGRVKHDWDWYGLLSRDANGAICGTMALSVHRLRFGSGALFYAPRGPVARDRTTAAALLAEATRLAKRQHAYLLRIDPPIDEADAAVAALRALGFRLNAATNFSLFQARYNYMIDLRGQTPESLLSRYAPSTRRNVRLAMRGGVAVSRGGVADLSDFCRMMAQTARKNGFSPRPQGYFRDILTEAPENAALYIARYEGRPAAAAITFRFGETMSMLYCCSDTAALSAHPNELLQYHMHCEALKAGCTRFDLRGVEGEPNESNPKFGLHRFKKSFGAELVCYAGQFDRTLRPMLAKAVAAYAKHR